MYVYTGFVLPGIWGGGAGRGGSPPNQPKICSFLPSAPLPHHPSPSIQPNKNIKASFLAVVIAPEPFLFYLYTLWKDRSC